MIRHLDLFAGIGGFSRAVEWLGGETVGFVEWDAWNRRVLAKHWPEARFYGDITTVTDDDLRSLGRIDLITGGYPCQPFSLAGKRLGAEDDRHLWPEMRRVINSARPSYVLAENVAGHVTMGLDVVLSELEQDGYACRAIVVPAGAVNALHRRDRVWILGANREAPDAGEARRPRPERKKHDGRSGTESGEGDVGGVAWHKGGWKRRKDVPPKSRDYTPIKGPGEGVAHSHGSGQQEHGGIVPVRAQHATSEHSRGVETGAKTERPLDAGADGLRPGPLRRPAARSAWDDPDLIRAMWADGSWEADLPRVVTDEPERRQKLMAAGNAIVPLVAYEILRVMLQEEP